MGAYLYPAGRAGAGIIPGFVGPPPPVIVTPRALKYDVQAKAFVMNADGQMADVHPVDAAVAMALTIEYGSVPSLPTFGTQLRQRVQRADPRQIPNIALTETKRCLQALIDRGDIQLISVQTDTSTRGRVLAAVAYVNLRDPNTNPTNPVPNQTRISFI